MPFLVRDDTVTAGYTSRTGPLPRTKEESYVPWALTHDRKVVYARTGQHRNKPTKSGLSPYDALASKQRRRLCQSALGSLALRNRLFWLEAVRQVSAGVKRFLIRKWWGNREATLALFSTQVGKYLYGTSYMSFGRISDVVPTGPDAARQMWDDCLGVLDASDPLPTVMGLHDQVGIKMVATGDPEYKTYKDWTSLFRADREGEMFHPQSRGRGDAPTRPTPSTVPGITSTGDNSGLPAVQLRKRGVDSYVRTSNPSVLDKSPSTARPGLSGIEYYQDLDNRNELFGAGPSGTTGTLLASALTFGKLDDEGRRQYLLAIIGYLIGGGMHSLHESLTVVKFLPENLRMEYNAGSLLRYEQVGNTLRAKVDDFPALPQTFTGSGEFANWRDEYYDVVVLGGIHWMFNQR